MSPFDVMGKAKGMGLKKGLRKFLQSDAGDAFLSILVRSERQLLVAMVEQHRLLGIEYINQLPDVDERKDLIRELILAKVDGRFPEWWVEEISPEVGIENAEMAADVANVDDEAWQAKKEEWASQYERDADVDAIAGGHVQAVHGVGLETFRRLVVEWDDDREAEALREVMVQGLDAVHDGIELSNRALEELDVDPDAVDVDATDLEPTHS